MKWARKLFVVLLLCSAMLELSAVARAAAPGMRRIALIVGANAAPPGRQALRFAYDDAKELATALQQVGGFPGAALNLDAALGGRRRHRRALSVKPSILGTTLLRPRRRLQSDEHRAQQEAGLLDERNRWVGDGNAQITLMTNRLFSAPA